MTVDLAWTPKHAGFPLQFTICRGEIPLLLAGLASDVLEAASPGPVHCGPENSTTNYSGLGAGTNCVILSSVETAGIKAPTSSSAAAPCQPAPRPIGEVSWEKMIRAVEKVRERLQRAAAALEEAKICYAVAGGNAVAAWVSRVDEAAVRNTQDVDILLRRSDLPAAKAALTKAGFIYRHTKGLDMFLDGPAAKERDSVHIVFAAEKVKPGSVAASPDVTDSEATETFRLVSLEALVSMKLTAFGDKDRTHLRDLIEVGLLDATWASRLAPELARRLQELLDSPEG